MKLRHYCFSQR